MANYSVLTASLSRIATPVQAAFIASLLLSIIAVMNNPVLNRDGMLYIETARNILKHGISGATQNFDWPLLPLLIAGLGYATQLNLESAAHILNALFMAGTCALMVDLIRRRMPEAAWIACLIVLAVPAYNGYRDYLAREFGYWFFSTLALWLALRWEDNAFRWHEAIACQIALICAVLFRLEAIVFFPAFWGWQLFSAPAKQKTSRVLKLAVLPMVAGLILLTLYATGLVKLPARAIYYLDAANIFSNSKISEQAAKLIGFGGAPGFLQGRGWLHSFLRVALRYSNQVAWQLRHSRGALSLLMPESPYPQYFGQVASGRVDVRCTPVSPGCVCDLSILSFRTVCQHAQFACGARGCSGF